MYGNGYFSSGSGSSTYHYNLLKVSSSIAASGDSGGIAYINNPSTSFSKAVGIVLGGSSSSTYFIKYSSIASDFGPTTY
ncbi:MAG: hypothetical protein IJK47_07010 [Lachnospiraceae bacterium]|nr:hypothetical protein [Lachnospiraceae bacterium]